MIMKNSLFTTTVATLTAIALSSAAAPEGYENQGGIWLGGTLNLSPFVNVSFLRDDNPSSARKYTIERAKEMPDAPDLELETDALKLSGGLNLLLPGNHWLLKGRGIFSSENYSKESIDDRTDWAQNLNFSRWTDNGTKWSVKESYQDIRYDDDFELSQNDRSEFALNSTADLYLSEKTSLLLSGFYRDRDYDDETCYDYLSYGGHLGIARAFTEKSQWTLTSIYTIHDKDRYDSKARGINTMLGFRTRSTEKLILAAQVGAEFFQDFEYPILNSDGTDSGLYHDSDSQVGFTYSVKMSWLYNRRLTFNVTGYSNFEPAEDVNDNSVYANILSLAANYKMGERWLLRGGIAFRRDDYSRDVKQSEFAGTINPYVATEKDGNNRTDTNIGSFASLSYKLNRYGSIFGEWNRTDVSSSIDDYDYDRQRFSIGLSLRY